MKDTNYYSVQGWMVNKLHLSGNELICYAIIYGFSQEGMSVFMGSLSYLEKWMNATKPTVIKALKSLVEKSLIIKQEVEKNNVRLCYYGINEETKESLLGGGKEPLLGGGKEPLPNNIKDNIKNNKEKNKDKSLSKKAQEGFVFPDDKEANFIKWCNENIPNVMRNKKPLSYAEYIQLQCDGFIPKKILDKLLYINAIAGFNRKYHDVYGVLKNWLNGDNDPNYYQKFKNKKKTDKAA
jgi:DNA-binding PadR family transcriptional regulator